MIKISILVDNVAGGKFAAEHGLSYLVEFANRKLLFDTGHSDMFLQNAKRLGISVEDEIETVVLSHGHWDHGNGLTYLNNKTLIAHPGVFQKAFRKANNASVRINLSQNEAEKRFNLKRQKTPVEFEPNLWFLGEVPRKNSFESQHTTFCFENGADDFVIDDTALAAIVNNQLVIISGCAHSGICNICEYAKQVTGINEIKAVIGGFHLKAANVQTQKTIEYFKKNGVKEVFPSHCTDLPALALFQQEFNMPQIKTGQTYCFE